MYVVFAQAIPILIKLSHFSNSATAFLIVSIHWLYSLTYPRPWIPHGEIKSCIQCPLGTLKEDNFLWDRTLHVRIQPSLSSVGNVDNGTPQGELLSSILFIYYHQWRSVSKFHSFFHTTFCWQPRIVPTWWLSTLWLPCPTRNTQLSVPTIRTKWIYCFENTLNIFEE